ncbi:MAG: phytoene/squalene synthase family protein [Acidobacteriota bacterium]|nr:phytoene/squalene synthase family protein [Acidobacteriota bacterium]
MSTAVQQASSQGLPTPSQLVVAYSVCRSITRRSAKNFYYGFLVLPRTKRQALCAVYAFMRKCDDIADDPGLPLSVRRQKLETWLDAFHRVDSGEITDDPVLLALADAQRRFGIRVGLLDELAYGTAMDVEDEASREVAREDGGSDLADALAPLYKTFDDLQRYCYRVASVVGLVCIKIFGYRDPTAETLAERCGLAFQLTNIIRDVKEDAAMGRVYLPEEDLAQFGVTASELRSGTASRFAPLLAMEADRAREYYRSGEELIPFVDEDSRPALWVLITIYRTLLEKIASRQYDVFSERISLPLHEKLSILAKGFLKRIT